MSVGRERVAVGSAGLAVVDGVLELADRVHPRVHVRGALLDRLLARRVGGVPEVEGQARGCRERQGRAVERRERPVVRVREAAVVVVELLVVLVRAAGAAVVHLTLRARREALQRAVRRRGLRVAAHRVPRLRGGPVRGAERRLHRRLV